MSTIMKMSFTARSNVTVSKLLQARRALPALGVLVVHAAADGLIVSGVAEARFIYGLYAGLKAAEVAKSDAAKLRQLILLGEHHGKDACDRAVRFHGREAKGHVEAALHSLGQRCSHAIG